MPQALHLLAIVFSAFAILVSPVLAAGTEEATTTASTGYAEAKALVDAENFTAALPALTAITQAEPENADAWNLLGYTNRMLGQNEPAAQAYEVALKLNPDHLGALEYQGELFLKIGQPDMAKANLAKLQSLCGTCEEYMDLAEAVQAAGA